MYTKRYSDSTLLRMTKRELIDHLRCEAVNCESAEQALERQAKNLADWEPVVHCRDCEWYNVPGCAIYIVDDSDRPGENDFCSFGKRKENADEDT